MASELAGIPAIENKLQVSWPYRSSQSRWAGGNHEVKVILSATPDIEGGSVRAWSRNGKWQGTNSYATIRLTARAIQAGVLIGGLVTLDAIPVGRREWQVVWAAQGKGFSLHPVTGWIIRGHHVPGGTLAAARKKTAAARQKTIRTLLAARQKKYTLSHVYVGREDSIEAGNCPTGTDTWISGALRQWEQSNGYGPIGGIRADILLSLRDDTYSRRAIAHAVTRLR